MRGLKRIIKGGFVNFIRGGIVSWAAVLVVSITLSVITSLILLQAVLHSSLQQIKDKVDVTIYLNVGAKEDKINELKNALTKLPEVAEINYVTEGENLRRFRELHSADYPTIQALDEIGENPLGGYLGVKAKEISQYETIATFLSSGSPMVLGPSSVVRKVNYAQNKDVIEKLNAIIDGAQKLGFLVTALLVLISVIITFNTIRLTIFISKEEIGVMRLVGASKMGVRGPFLIEGVIYGIIATIVTLVIFWPATAWLGRNMSGFLGLNVYEYYVSNIFYILLLVLSSGIILGVVSSFLAIRKYLNK